MRFLPPYSHDFNPIEAACALIKVFHGSLSDVDCDRIPDDLRMFVLTPMTAESEIVEVLAVSDSIPAPAFRPLDGSARTSAASQLALARRYGDDETEPATHRGLYPPRKIARMRIEEAVDEKRHIAEALARKRDVAVMKRTLRVRCGRFAIKR